MSDHQHASNDGLAVDHHFENADQQYQSAKLGMWVFLATEILFFGGLFVAYSVYRANHPEVFVFGHHFLDKNLGALNTVILICSSLTAAWAVRAAQLKQIGMLKLMILLTMLFAFGFMGVKSVEYNSKWKHGLLWAGQLRPPRGARGARHTEVAESVAENAAATSTIVDQARRPLRRARRRGEPTPIAPRSHRRPRGRRVWPFRTQLKPKRRVSRSSRPMRRSTFRSTS